MKESSAADLSNVLPSAAGLVQLELGPFHGVSSTTPLHHVFAEAYDGFDDEITLSYEAHNEFGDAVQFGFPYLEGPQTFEFAERGFAQLAIGGTSLSAESGTVRVAVLDGERMRVDFEHVRFTSRDEPRGTGVSRTIDGSVEGSVERICLVQTTPSPQSSASTTSITPERVRDTEWRSEFCATYAHYVP